MALERDWVSGMCRSICRVQSSTERPLILLVAVPGALTVVNEFCAKCERKAKADHHVHSSHKRVDAETFFEHRIAGFGLGMFQEGLVTRAQQLPLFDAGSPFVLDESTKKAVDGAFERHALEVFCGEGGDEVVREEEARIALGILRRERLGDPSPMARQAELARWIVAELLGNRGFKQRGSVNEIRPSGPLAKTHLFELFSLYKPRS